MQVWMYYVSQLPLPVVKEWLVGDAWGAGAHSPLVISTRSSIGSTLLAVCALLSCGGHGCGAQVGRAGMQSGYGAGLRLLQLVSGQASQRGTPTAAGRLERI